MRQTKIMWKVKEDGGDDDDGGDAKEITKEEDLETKSNTKESYDSYGNNVNIHFGMLCAGTFAFGTTIIT